MRKSVYSPINLVLLVINLKMILKKLIRLANLSKAQALYIYKVMGIVVICKNKNLIFTNFYLVLPGFKKA